jgi:hypothetical protein
MQQAKGATNAWEKNASAQDFSPKFFLLTFKLERKVMLRCLHIDGDSSFPWNVA